MKLDNLKSFHEIRLQNKDNQKALDKLKESMPKMRRYKIGERTFIEVPDSFTEAEAKKYISDKYGKANIV